MGHPDGAHTHGGGGSGLGELAVILLAVALLGRAVAAAVAELVHVLLIVAVALAVLAGSGLVALGAWRLRSGRQNTARMVYRVTSAPKRSPLRSDSRSAIEAPRQVHLHLHGVTAEDVAAILAQHGTQVDHPEL
jgi:hypothetical protein